jgi:hypothetical protein
VRSLEVPIHMSNNDEQKLYMETIHFIVMHQMWVTLDYYEVIHPYTVDDSKSSEPSWRNATSFAPHWIIN